MFAKSNEKPAVSSVLKRQLAVCAAFAALLGIIVASLYVQDRRREWTLRTEQAKHRLDFAVELISREIDGARADALFLADQRPVRQFVQGDESQLQGLEAEYINFVRRKEMYDQIRLLDLDGHETIRVNYAPGGSTSVLPTELQDKSDRYYFRDAVSLRPGEVLVSDFDLNVEHRRIEKPLKPVIRLVTPVADDAGTTRGFLVLNYLGARLLHELDDSSLPGSTMLLRPDGHYLRSPDDKDAWGWLLDHDRRFDAQFPDEWSRIEAMEDCTLTPSGAFAVRNIQLGNPTYEGGHKGATGEPRDSIFIVAYLPRDQVFEDSRGLLKRLLVLAGSVFIPLAIFARFWAHAMMSRRLQNEKLALSELRLRELSSRLLRIQEDERRAVSREIHDELGQQATAINLDLKLAERNFKSEQAKPLLERAIRENEQLLETLHAFATRVRPAVLDDLGLKDALESHLWEFQQRTSIEVDANLSFDSSEIPDEIADNTYRLLQESLNNVAKHADASNVRVTVVVENSESSPQLCMAIRDDGRGYSAPEQVGDRLGLVGMQERVDLLAGKLRIESDIDKGTNIDIKLPLRDRAAEQRSVEHEA